MFTLTDILTNASGDRIRAHFVIVVDVATGAVKAFAGAPPTFRPVGSYESGRGPLFARDNMGHDSFSPRRAFMRLFGR